LARISHELPATPRYRIAQHGCLPAEDEIILLGPARRRPISLIRGRYRFRLLAKAPRNADIQSFLRDLFCESAESCAAAYAFKLILTLQNFF
jgi:primosomal protein N' (replication factor Y)